MPYPSYSSEVVLEIPAVDTVAQARDVEIVTGVMISGRRGTTGPLV